MTPAELEALRALISEGNSKIVERLEKLSRVHEELGEGVHRTNNLVQTIIVDAQILIEMQKFMERLLDLIEGKVDNIRKEVAKSTPPPPITEE